MKQETIIAQATPPGQSGIGVIRISGMNVHMISKKVIKKKLKPRYAHYTNFFDLNGNVIDQGIAIWFPKPNSFTGEDVLELQGHGGQVVLNLILKNILQVSGVRIAKPGEFSERAFLNNKIDLVQAEAISDLINANSEQAARSAMNSLQGKFSLRINFLLKKLIEIRTQVEVEIDFPEENIETLLNKKIEKKLKKIIKYLTNIIKESNYINSISQGIKLVIAGPPNTGKSSLFNKLVKREAAIVSDIAGTTRDVLNEHIAFNKILFHIVDTAGFRNTSNEIEKIGIFRASETIKNADQILFVIDQETKICKKKLKDLFPESIKNISEKIPIIIIKNKIDIINKSASIEKINNYFLIHLSVLTGEGIPLLYNVLKKSFNSVECSFLARKRHIQSLYSVLQHIKKSLNLILDKELLAEELRLSQIYLNEITGKFTSDDLLTNIFSNFCIGK